MNEPRPTRRRFLLAALAFSTAAVTGTTWLRGAAANPTLTIVALAIRQADHIAERMTQKTL